MEEEIRNQLDELLESGEDIHPFLGLLENQEESSIDADVDSDNETEQSHFDWREQLSDGEQEEVEEMVLEWIDEYVQNEILSMASPAFHEQLIKEISVLLKQQLVEMQLIQGKSEDSDEDIEEYVKEKSEYYFEETQLVPPRSFKVSVDPSKKTAEEKAQLLRKIEKLQQIPQPKQKTPEWYEYRHRMITASNLWKVFGSESQRNSLIYEKCKPLESGGASSFSGNYANANSPLHWGVKYEPVSIQLYEKKYGTRVADFGCISHPLYSFIGASPDGIVVDPDSPRFGRMIEVKNIYNREINGIPKEEYWIQMQIQMETWDLEECDFIETRFKEFESEEDFYSMELLYEHRGVVLYFVSKSQEYRENSNAPRYEYMPMDIPLEKDAIQEWIDTKRAQYQQEYSLYDTQYWYLDEWSCITVKRNREWFQKAVPQMEECWNTILKEKVDGYDHRASKSRSGSKVEVCFNSQQNTQVIRNMPLSNSICLVKLDECGVQV
jgi:putative phage-type endonuclease